jgi:protocatechuate 3,4-dioxygenase beta subunit
MDDVYSRAGNDADPPYLSPDYMGTRTRSPKRPLILIPQTLSEVTGPVYGHSDVKVEEADLTFHHASEPLGERIIVKGRVLDERGRPVPNTLVEIWQCNAAGRYHHAVDQHHAPPTSTSLAPAAASPMPPATTLVSTSPAPIPGATIPTPGARPTSASPCSPSFPTRLSRRCTSGDPLFPST